MNAVVSRRRGLWGCLLAALLIPSCALDESPHFYPSPAGASMPPVTPGWQAVMLELIADGLPPRFILQGDLDDDGLPDLVLGRSFADPSAVDGEMSVYLATAEGVYSAIPFDAYDLPPGTTCGVLADFDDDDVLDILLGSIDGLGSGALTLRLGRGDGTFEDPQDLILIEVLELAAGDFDGNGGFDVAAATALQTLIYRNSGGILSFETALADRGLLKSSDFFVSTGDELAVASGGTVRIYEDLLGTPGIAGTLSIPGGFDVRSLSMGDGDADGDLDLVCAAEQAGAGAGMAVFFRNSPAGFSAAEPLFSAPGAIRGAALLDYDEDGLPDITAYRQGISNTLALALGAVGPMFVAAAAEEPSGLLLLFERGPSSGIRGSLVTATSAGFFLLWRPPIP